MKIMNLLALAALTLPAIAQAGDASEYQPLGFSPNGQFFAFAQVGTSDGSGAAFANVQVVEVAKNLQLVNKTSQEDFRGDEPTGDIRPQLKKAIASANLRRFGIVPGRNLGKDLLVRMPTDHSEYPRSVFSFEHWAEGGASSTAPRYGLVLEQKNAPNNSWEGLACSDYGMRDAQMIKLSLVGGENTDGSTQVLQEDTRLPKTRACSNGYEVRRVTAYKNKLVVNLSFRLPGFEGPDERQMVVTGDVKVAPRE